MLARSDPKIEIIEDLLAAAPHRVVLTQPPTVNHSTTSRRRTRRHSVSPMRVRMIVEAMGIVRFQTAWTRSPNNPYRINSIGLTKGEKSMKCCTFGVSQETMVNVPENGIVM